MDFGKRERPIMVDMEQQLLDDKIGMYRRSLIDKLAQYEAEVNAMMHNANADNELFMRYSALKTALQKAKFTIEKF